MQVEIDTTLNFSEVLEDLRVEIRKDKVDYIVVRSHLQALQDMGRISFDCSDTALPIWTKEDIKAIRFIAISFIKNEQFRLTLEDLAKPEEPPIKVVLTDVPQDNQNFRVTAKTSFKNFNFEGALKNLRAIVNEKEIDYAEVRERLQLFESFGMIGESCSTSALPLNRKAGKDNIVRIAKSFLSKCGGKPKTITLSNVKDRGWTDKMIADVLGDYHLTARNPHYRSAAPMRLYFTIVVKAAELTVADKLAKNLARREKLADTAIERATKRREKEIAEHKKAAAEKRRQQEINAAAKAKREAAYLKATESDRAEKLALLESNPVSTKLEKALLWGNKTLEDFIANAKEKITNPIDHNRNVPIEQFLYVGNDGKVYEGCYDGSINPGVVTDIVKGSHPSIGKAVLVAAQARGIRNFKTIETATNIYSAKRNTIFKGSSALEAKLHNAEKILAYQIPLRFEEFSKRYETEAIAVSALVQWLNRYVKDFPKFKMRTLKQEKILKLAYSIKDLWIKANKDRIFSAVLCVKNTNTYTDWDYLHEMRMATGDYQDADDHMRSETYRLYAYELLIDGVNVRFHSEKNFMNLPKNSVVISSSNGRAQPLTKEEKEQYSLEVVLCMIGYAMGLSVSEFSTM